MDIFLEQGVTKRNRTASEIGYILATVLMGLAGLAALFDLSVIMSGFTILGVVEILIFAGMAVGMFFVRNQFRQEYDYTFTNGILDFARVYNASRRKELGSLKIKNIEAFGKVSGQGFQRYISMPGIHTDRWFLNREAELYYFYFQKNGNKRLIILEPNEELVDAIRHYLPQGAMQA